MTKKIITLITALLLSFIVSACGFLGNRPDHRSNRHSMRDKRSDHHDKKDNRKHDNRKDHDDDDNRHR